MTENILSNTYSNLVIIKQINTCTYVVRLFSSHFIFLVYISEPMHLSKLHIGTHVFQTAIRTDLHCLLVGKQVLFNGVF